MKKVIFIADGHTYWLDAEDSLSKNPIPQKPGQIVEIPSVGSVYGKYFPEFDTQYWLTNGTLKVLMEDKLKEQRKSIGGFKPPAEAVFGPLLPLVSPEEFFKKRVELQSHWNFKGKNSCFLGSKFHKKLENQAIASGFVINPWTSEKFKLIHDEKWFDNESVCEDLYDLEDGAYAELLVFDLDLNIAGQIDECFIKSRGKTRKVWINDHKSNEEKPSTSSPDWAWGPLKHLNASKHSRYSMQLSTYGYILQKAGFVVQDIGYTFYKNYDEAKKEHIKIKPLFAEVEAILAESALS